MKKVLPAPDDCYLVHGDPVWREKSDLVFQGYVGTSGGVNQWEQLWGRRVSEDRFIVCCIPFFLYDVGLGDEVELDQNSVLLRVVRSAGTSPFRIWLPTLQSHDRDELVQSITDLGATLEWSSQHLLAVSTDREPGATAIANLLEVQSKLGRLSYENGRTSKQ